MKDNYKKMLLSVSLIIFTSTNAFSMTKEELEEWSPKAAGVSIGSALGHVTGKYIVPAIMLRGIDETQGEDFGILGGLIRNAFKGHSKSELADSITKHSVPIGIIIGAAVGGGIGYATGDTIPKSIKKVCYYWSGEADSQDPSLKPGKLDYALTIGTGCGVLASCVYLCKAALQ